MLGPVLIIFQNLVYFAVLVLDYYGLVYLGQIYPCLVGLVGLVGVFVNQREICLHLQSSSLSANYDYFETNTF